MDVRLSDQVPIYRHKVGEFAAKHAPSDVLERAWATGTIHDPGVHQAMVAEGWIGVTWPRHLGGGGWHPAEAAALWEAMNYHRLPVDLLTLTEMAAWVIQRCGSLAMQEDILPSILAGETLIALGYTEPDSGSDVAAAKTAAIRGAHGWSITGTKMFITGAHASHHILLLARTNPEAPKHRGLTLFLVPQDAPGLHMQPVRTFGGERTNALFLDDVRVPDSAVVGDVDGGWAVLNIALDFERSMMGTYVGRAQRVFDDLVATLRRNGTLGAATVHEKLAALNCRIEGARVLADAVACRIAAGRPFAVEAAMTKLAATEAFKAVAYAALDLAGPHGLLAGHDADDPLAGLLEHWFRHCQIATIYGGSNEIQRNIVAQHGLGLPR